MCCLGTQYWPRSFICIFSLRCEISYFHTELCTREQFSAFGEASYPSISFEHLLLSFSHPLPVLPQYLQIRPVLLRGGDNIRIPIIWPPKMCFLSLLDLRVKAIASLPVCKWFLGRGDILLETIHIFWYHTVFNVLLQSTKCHPCGQEEREGTSSGEACSCTNSQLLF